ARALGVHVADEAVEKALALIDLSPEQATASMQRDIMADSVAQFGAHVRTSGRLPLLQASKARERPLATGRLVLLARTQPTVDAHQIDGRRDLQVVQVHLVLSSVARLSQSPGAHSL